MDNCSTGTISQYTVKTQSGIRNLTTPSYIDMAESSEPTCSRQETHFMMRGSPQPCYLPHHTQYFLKPHPNFWFWTHTWSHFMKRQYRSIWWRIMYSHTQLHLCSPKYFLFFWKKKKKTYYLGKLTISWPVQQNKRFVVFSFSMLPLLWEAEIAWEGNRLA